METWFNAQEIRVKGKAAYVQVDGFGRATGCINWKETNVRANDTSARTYGMYSVCNPLCIGDVYSWI
jgi:hypothetical protein